MSESTKNRSRLRRRSGILGFFGVFVVLVCGAIFVALLDPAGAVSDSSSTIVAPTATSAYLRSTTTASISSVASTLASALSSTSTTLFSHAIKDPTRVVIPAIGADALIVKVGVLENGSMEVPPFGLAGWFRVGPAPGAPGPAVIVGHVDTKKGPDVFYHLKDLKPGDEVFVYDVSGDAATFVVDSSELTLKSELPTYRIWNETPEPVIRLITCGGKFDRSTGHYLSNTIVYGHLVR